MTLDTVIMLAGAAVAVLPFLGFPPSWDMYFFVALGVLVFALGIIVRRTEGHSKRALRAAPPEPLDDGEVA